MITLENYINNDYIYENKYTNIVNDELINEVKIDINKIYPMQIPSKEILQKIVDVSNPKAPSKDKGGKGLYEFNELLKKESSILDIGKKPFNPIYVCFMSNDSGKNPNSTKFYGIAGFSNDYFIKKNKACNDIDSEILKKMKGFLHILIWQTDPQYAKEGLAKKYLEILEKAAKELHSKAITIKSSDDKTTEIYKSLGFKEIDSLKDYLILPLKEEK